MYLLCGRHLHFTAIVATLRSMVLSTNVMLFEDGVEELNIIALCSLKTMSKLFSPCFFPRTLLLCCALHRDMYQQTGKYWSSKARL
jgi:hypothetical protein